MTARDRRGLVIGAAIVGVAILVLRGLPSGAHRLAELRRSAIERRATLERARSVLAGRLAARDSFEHVVAGIVGFAPHVLDGRTAPDAQASLSGLVSLAAGRHAVRVLRLDPVNVPDTTSSAFSEVRVHAEVESDISGILKLIRALETADPVITIRSVDISAPNTAAWLKQPEALHGELTVAGYYLPRGTP